MISILVMVTGLLGVAGMQLTSVQNNQGAFLRTQATYIASDFLDRIRANRKGYLDGEYNSVDTSESATQPNCAATANGCNARQLAQHDILELTANFNNIRGTTNFKPMLPAGGATVVRDTSGAFDEYIVTVFWNEKDWESSGGEVVRGSNIQRSVQLRSVMR